MKDGFVRVAAGTPAIRTADCMGNAEAIIGLMREAQEKDVRLLVLPEMCVTGYTAADLLLHGVLLDAAERALEKILEASRGSELLLCVGMPVRRGAALYSCAVFVQSGRVLGAVPKARIPAAGAAVEPRYFAPGPEQGEARLCGETIPFGTKLLFACEEMPEFVVGAQVCEDFWQNAQAGVMQAATIVAVPSATEEIVGRSAQRRLQLRADSAKNVCALVCAEAGQGESTTDLVFGGHDLIAENGALPAESKKYTTGIVTADIDCGFLARERRRQGRFAQAGEDCVVVPFHMQPIALELQRWIDPAPFIPADEREREARCEEILEIQAQGLAARIRHIHCKSAVLAVSGGLDSTLALLVLVRAFDLCGLPHKSILTVTMPCFGTTGRTRSNAQIISERLDTDFREIRIEAAVRQHFADIGHDIDRHDVTYENSQARERTQILMDLANKTGGIAVGTGDLSEMVLGWATYNGDHMSMYGVNAGVPKTLVRHLVAYEAAHAQDEQLAEALRDILATPVSPELLPPVDGEIAQKTEDLVGPYDLHDFFIYHILRRGESPEKTARLACIAFADRYDERTVRGWLKVFARRFFSQQFKRSCMPDGPKIGSVSLSPRGDLRMASDAVGTLWQLD
ncbi:MAG: NAD(+) synthase [Eubacteriales bacterium]|nr:NAD(+) synthase [Eubacteriales bacterium]